MPPLSPRVLIKYTFPLRSKKPSSFTGNIALSWCMANDHLLFSGERYMHLRTSELLPCFLPAMDASSPPLASHRRAKQTIKAMARRCFEAVEIRDDFIGRQANSFLRPEPHLVETLHDSITTTYRAPPLFPGRRPANSISSLEITFSCILTVDL